MLENNGFREISKSRNRIRRRTVVFIGMSLCFLVVPGIGRVLRHTEDQAFFPLELVLEKAEVLLDADLDMSVGALYFNHLAGALTLHGRFIPAERALATSLRLHPTQADALFLLGALRCAASRLGEARDAFYKGYHSRSVSNAFESAAVNSDTCSTLPLLYPADAVSHERSYSLFPHYSHTERFYLLQRDPADEIRRCVAAPSLTVHSSHPRAAAAASALPGEVHSDLLRLAGAEAMLARSEKWSTWTQWAGETMLKQSHGDAALREGVTLAALGSVGGGKYSDHFPLVLDNPQLLLAVSEANGRWSAYEVEQVHAIHSDHFVREALKHGGSWAEAARLVPGGMLPPERPRDNIYKGGGTNGSAGSSSRHIGPLAEFVRGCLEILDALQEAGIVHNNLNAEAMLVRSVGGRASAVLVDAEIAAVPGLRGPSSSSLTHSREFHAAGAPSDAYTLGRSLEKVLHRANVTAFDCVLALLLNAIDTSVRHPHISYRPHPYALGDISEGARRGWSKTKSGIPAHRLGDFFFNMGAELTSVQEDAMALFEEAAEGALVYKAVARSNLFTASNALCCWQRHPELREHQHAVLLNASLCRRGIAERCYSARALVVPSIDALAQDLDLPELLLLHQAWADWFYSRHSPVEWRPFLGLGVALAFPHNAQKRIILVYASSHTWMNHGSHMTLRSMFGEHDDARVEAVHLIMVGEQEIEKAGTLPQRQRFINIAHISDFDAAEQLNEMGAHILVDFNGYLSGTRMAIAALQPCPICLHHFAQVHNFLGDKVITPPEHAPYYSEKLIYLPGIFLSTSAATTTPEALTFDPNLDIPRAGLDLPMQDAVLLCNFNAFYKIHPQQLQVWKEVMLENPHTVLVLRAKWGAGSQCLVDLLSASGIAPERLHFTGDLSGEAHSRRCGACDLVVDTDNFNGITTTATVLWTGTPVVTFATVNNAGRCSATMLRAMNASALIARNRADYKALLSRLVSPRGKGLLRHFRRGIAAARLTSPLFQPRYLAKGFEQLALLLWELFKDAGHRPKSHHLLVTHLRHL